MATNSLLAKPSMKLILPLLLVARVIASLAQVEAGTGVRPPWGELKARIEAQPTFTTAPQRREKREAERAGFTQVLSEALKARLAGGYLWWPYVPLCRGRGR